jgi:two-component system sensor histidine kinase YesM
MRRRVPTFADQAIGIIYFLFFSLFIVSVVFCWVLYKSGQIRFWLFVWILLIAIALFVVSGTAFYRWVLTPYHRCRKLFRKLINEQTYKELLDEKYQVFPEMKAVLERLLDRQDAIRLSTKQAEFLALQNQINPHFLYNTLEAIRGDALSAGLENIADITEALATFFRYTITETGNLVALEEELENVENYFMIQQYRFGEKLKLKICLPEEKQHVLQLQFPKLTLQPIVENAIFHGLEGKAEGGTILIEVETTADHVMLSIRDDGVGIPEEILDRINESLNQVSVGFINEDKKKSASIALNNVCRRIKLLFGEEYGIHIYSVIGVGTDVRIKIPAVASQKGVGR